jgi:inner membrane protein
MPSAIGHTLVGISIGGVCYQLLKNTSWKKLIVLSLICANAPDIDVLFHHLNLDHIEFLSHRNGFFHSVFFCVIAGFIFSFSFYKKSRLLLFLYFSLVCFSHLLFDSMTKGIGVSFLYPLVKTEYIFPFAPLMPAGFNTTEFGKSGVILKELLYIWIPCMIIITFSFFKRKS